MSRIVDAAGASAPPHAPESISAEIADWRREAKTPWGWDPARSLLASLRAHERASPHPDVLHGLLRWASVLRHRFWSVVTGAEIPLGSRIDGGLLLPHPNGIVIHPHARVGPNCLIFQQVTIGTGGSIEGVPTLAGHVDVGAGARILGGVTIGAHARIGANAVVLCDVPAGATAVGIPARIVGRPDATGAASPGNG